MAAHNNGDILDAILNDRLDDMLEWIDKSWTSVTDFLDTPLVDLNIQEFLNMSFYRYYRMSYIQKRVCLLDRAHYLSHPLNIAVGYASRRCFLWLWERATPLHTENVLHSVLVALSNGLIDETECVQMICLVKELCRSSEDDLKHIFLHENRHGLRPLEVATQIGAYHAFVTILDTKPLYLKSVLTVGTLQIRTYDLSEYSPYTYDPKFSRYWLSPLRLLAGSPTTFLPALSASDILQHPLIFQWYRMTFQRNFLHIMCSILSIFLLAFLYPTVGITEQYIYIFNMINKESVNASTFLWFSPCVGKNESFMKWKSNFPLVDMIQSYYVQMYTSAYLNIKFIFNIIIIYHNCKRDSYINDRSSFHSNASCKIVGQLFLFSVSYLLYLFLFLIFINSTICMQDNCYDDLNIGVVDMSTLFAAFLSFLHLLQYLTLLPVLGPTLIMFLKSLGTLLPFMVIYMSILGLLGYMFLLQMPCLEFPQFMNGSWFGSAVINVFRLSLGIVDISIAQFHRIWILQLFLVIIVPIFVLNFIIAFISNMVNFVASNEGIFYNLNKLHFALNYETWYRLIPWCIVRHLHSGYHRSEHVVVMDNVKEKRCVE